MIGHHWSKGYSKYLIVNSWHVHAVCFLQEDKDSTSGKESLDDLFPSEEEEQSHSTTLLRPQLFLYTFVYGVFAMSAVRASKGLVDSRFTTVLSFNHN